jgi:lipid-A-disaccharide synthase-like uncharacterized protein
VTGAVLITGIGLVLLLPIAWRVWERRLDPFEPIIVFVLAWGVMFVLRPAAILIRDDTNFYGVDIGPTLDRAVLLGLLGAVGFVVGYELAVGRRLAEVLPDPPLESGVRGRLLLACVTSALGLLALALFLLSSGGVDAVEVFLGGRSEEFLELLTGSTLYLWWASLLVLPAAMVVFATAMTTRRRPHVALAALLIGVALVRTVPVGNRIFLLSLVGGMLVFLYVARDRRPGLIALGVGVAVALIASYTVLNFRYPETRASFSSVISGLVRGPVRALEPLTSGADAEMAPALAGALRVVPHELPYRFGGATIGDLLRRPIPRQLWSGKPQAPGHEVTASVWPEARRLGNFDPAYTPVLFLFWDFGLPGVFVGMALFGAIARALYEYFLRFSSSLFVQLLFSMSLWYVVVAARGDPVGVIVQAVILFVPLFSIFWFSARRQVALHQPSHAAGETTRA